MAYMHTRKPVIFDSSIAWHPVALPLFSCIVSVFFNSFFRPVGDQELLGEDEELLDGDEEEEESLLAYDDDDFCAFLLPLLLAFSFSRWFPAISGTSQFLLLCCAMGD